MTSENTESIGERRRSSGRKWKGGTERTMCLERGSGNPKGARNENKMEYPRDKGLRASMGQLATFGIWHGSRDRYRG